MNSEPLNGYDQRYTARLLLLNKPKGVVVTRSDERGRKTVYSLLPQFTFQDGWMPIGRLDMDSRGLLLFTREGFLQDLLTKPGVCVKVYELWVRGHVIDTHCVQALEGVNTSLGSLRLNMIELLGRSGHKSRVRVELNEGKNRHLRRLFGALQDPKFHTPLKVLDLKRTQIGTLKLNIPSSRWRFLTIKEETDLIQCVKSNQ
ncbi:MAG: pseudouridine synthase [Candidatus Anammoxibacter sp.]